MRARDAELTKAVSTLSRAFQRAPEGAGLLTLEILAGVPSPVVAAELSALLARERDPASIAGLLESVGKVADPTAAESIFAYLEHESWHVQSAAASALSELRSKAAIPVLIEHLDSAEGRVLTDVRGALVSLTGEDFHTNIVLWRTFWEEHGATFEVPPKAPAAGRADDEERGGVTFFGIHTDSQRVLFVLDLSEYRSDDQDVVLSWPKLIRRTLQVVMLFSLMHAVLDPEARLGIPFRYFEV